MNQATKLLFGLSISLVIAVFFGWRFELLTVSSFAWGFTIFLTTAGCYLAMKYVDSKRESSREKKRGLQYCWRVINEKLASMDNPDTLEWRGGEDKITALQTYIIDNKTNYFRAVVGRLKESQMDVVVIFNIDEEEIWKFVADPSPTLLRDPFDGFEPTKKSRSYSPDMFSRSGRAGRYARPYGQPGMMPGNQGVGGAELPDNEFVDRAFRE